MVWPFSPGSGRENTEPVPADNSPDATQQPTSYERGKKLLLEDTPPRFSTAGSVRDIARRQESTSFAQAWQTITWEEFSFAKLASIPCFRNAGMAGFTSMCVVGSIVFLYHKSPSKAANWSVGGLLLGSAVGWEQCRMRRQRSFEAAQAAKHLMTAKQTPMLKKPINGDSTKKLDSDGSSVTKKPPWYRFW